MDPRRLTGVVVGHLHADHYVDLVSLRYLFPWGDRVDDRMAVRLPPGGRDHLTSLAVAISERPTFFDDSFDAEDYEPAAEATVGELRLRFFPGLHYVPAWGVEVTAPDGGRLVYVGDTGPNAAAVEAARGADLFVCEATLESVAEDDPARRGHLTTDEALEMASAAAAARVLLVHYPSARRDAIARRCAQTGGLAVVAIPDLSLDVCRPGSDDRAADPTAGGIAGAEPRAGFGLGPDLALEA